MRATQGLCTAVTTTASATRPTRSQASPGAVTSAEPGHERDHGDEREEVVRPEVPAADDADQSDCRRGRDGPRQRPEPAPSRPMRERQVDEEGQQARRDGEDDHPPESAQRCGERPVVHDHRRVGAEPVHGVGQCIDAAVLRWPTSDAAPGRYRGACKEDQAQRHCTGAGELDAPAPLDHSAGDPQQHSGEGESVDEVLLHEHSHGRGGTCRCGEHTPTARRVLDRGRP